MAITLTERPFRLGFSKNESRYIFTVTNPASAGCAVQVRLFYHTITSASAPPVLITDIKLTPTPDGNVAFYAQTYFESILKLQMPAAGSTTALAATNQHCYFWIEYRQVTDLAPNNAWIITERDRKRIMMLGGIEVQKYERNNFFENYLIPDKWWLTWLPTNRFVGLDQEHYLSWFKTITDAEDFVMKVKVVYTDATEDNTVELALPAGNNFVYHLPTGVAQLGLAALNPDKTIHYYEVHIENVADGVQANPYRFYIDYDYYYKKFDWVYLNSLGGLDAVRVKGRYTRDIEREVSSASTLNLINQINDPVKNSDTIDTGILLTKKWKGDVGFMNSPDEQDGVADLLPSTEVFEKIDGRWLRIKLLTKTQPMGGSEDKKWSFPVEFMYGWVNDIYTPDKKNFGAGSNTGEVYDATVSACANPTGLAVVFNAEITGMAEMKFSWTHPGNIEAIIEVKEDGTDTWVPYSGDLTGLNEAYALFVADGRTMNWRLKVKCPNDDESAYVNGPDFTLIISGSACAVPFNLAVNKGTPSGGLIPTTFSWNHASAADFKLEYRAVGAPSWTLIDVIGATSHIVNLADDFTEYEWRVSAVCGAGSISPAVNGINFISSSSVTCEAPTGLLAEVMSSTGTHKTIRFSWSHGASLDYLLQWESLGGYTGTETPAVDYVDIEFPISYTIIYWQVAAQCSVGDYSSFSNGAPIYL